MTIKISTMMTNDDILNVTKYINILEREIAVLQTCDDALYWLLNLHNGISKGHPNPIIDSEWEAAVEAGMNAHANARMQLLKTEDWFNIVEE